jgi:hypothetical protein
MKHVAPNYKYGDLAVVNVPVLACKPEGVLVRSLYSLISTGGRAFSCSSRRLRTELELP